MAMTARQIADSEQILPLIQQQSTILLQAYRANPRLASIFATQQRWLLAHAALALHFRAIASGQPMLTLSRLFACVAEHDVSSRNTADAFVKEMMHYGYVLPVDDPADRRSRPLTAAPATLEAIYGWAVTHLATLDTFDGGRRRETFLATDGAIVRLHPEITDSLLTNAAIRQPQHTFSLFTWLNNGGIIMDWLIMGLGPLSEDGQRYPTSVSSIADLSKWLTLSSSHLGRKLREAEAMGSLGWTAKRGDSAMWVSVGFVREMIDAQANKLAVIDDAFERCFGS